MSVLSTRVTAGHSTCPAFSSAMPWPLFATRGGGRVPPRGAELDLVQDFFIKVLARKKEIGAAALVAEWEAMEERAFVAYVKKSLKNLAVEANPAWDLHRGLRDMVVAVLEDGLPVTASAPASLDENGRYVRALVARACAVAVAGGTPANVKALTKELMERYWVGEREVLKEAASEQEARREDLMAMLDTEGAAGAIAATYLEEAGAEGKRLFVLRTLGFVEMARCFGVALATIHARYNKALKRLAELARALGFGREDVVRAVELLKAA